MDIFDMIKAEPIAEYVEAIDESTDPLLGATLFPNKKIMGLDLQFIKGYGQRAIALKPSALGARALVRDRIGAAVLQHELPFFREKMVIDEKLRQQLARAKQDATDPYTSSILEQIFDDANALYLGANVQAERERMSLLFTGKINISAADKDGNQPKYAYEYDVDGSWETDNIVKLKSTAKWSDTANSNPIKDIIEIVDKADAMGVTLANAVISPTTWSHIMQNAHVKSLFKLADGTQKIFSRAMALTEIETMTGIKIAIYNKNFVDENGKTKSYAPDNAMALFPDGALGSTVYGTTPEEIDLISGYGNAETKVVNTGVAITTHKTYGPPVTVDTVVSQLVLPSFERMAEVFVINY